jgi:putative transposase
MKQQPATPTYTRHRFPPAIIAYGAWLSFRFARSYRDVEELLAERGVIVTYETIRRWCQKSGQA